MAAVARSAQLAQETATAHAEIISAVRDTIRAYDSAMTSMTAPDHLPGNLKIPGSLRVQRETSES